MGLESLGVDSQLLARDQDPLEGLMLDHHIREVQALLLVLPLALLHFLAGKVRVVGEVEFSHLS